MKGYQVNVYVNGKLVKWDKTRDYATAVGMASIWSQKVDFVENGRIVQTMPDQVQFMDLDSGRTVTKNGGERW